MEEAMDIICVLVTLVVLEHIADGSMWRRDTANVKFQSVLDSRRVEILEGCVAWCSTFQHCFALTYNTVTRECRTYSSLEGPVHENNTSLWKVSCLPCSGEDAGSKFAFFDKSPMSWSLANTTCVSLGGNLAIVDTPKEQEDVKAVISTLPEYNHWWLGGEKTDGTWRWIDGRDVNMTDGSWHNNEPNLSGTCLQYWRSQNKYKLDDTRCSNQKPYICEVDRTVCC